MFPSGGNCCRRRFFQPVLTLLCSQDVGNVAAGAFFILFWRFYVPKWWGMLPQAFFSSRLDAFIFPSGGKCCDKLCNIFVLIFRAAHFLNNCTDRPPFRGYDGGSLRTENNKNQNNEKIGVRPNYFTPFCVRSFGVIWGCHFFWNNKWVLFSGVNKIRKP